MASLCQAYQVALDSAIVRISKENLAKSLALEPSDLAARISLAFEELDKLQTDEIPDYTSVDVALFYGHWFLPAQVNLAYSLTVDCLAESTLSGSEGRPIQLVDFGAGSGAMVLGLILALAERLPRDRWPEMIAVYQLDEAEAMLNLGDDIWRSLHAEVDARIGLSKISDLMARTDFERADSTPDGKSVPRWTEAERWLTALHVVYEEMDDTKLVYGKLQESVRPHFRVVTATTSKKKQIKSPKPVVQRLEGMAGALTTYRRTLADKLYGQLGAKEIKYLKNNVQWAAHSKKREPVANLRFPGSEGER